MQFGLFLESEFGDVTDEFQMDDADCIGIENTLLDCKHTKRDNCNAKEGAGVVCSDPFRKCRARSITTNCLI